MCGIVGLHLRNPELYPRLGELLTGMLCEMSNRGSDSAGVAVYGDPRWSPPGHGTVSVLDVDDSPEQMAAALHAALGEVSVHRVDETLLVSADAAPETLHAAITAHYPHALIAGFGADVAVLKGVGHPKALTEAWGLAERPGLAGGGPHPDGHRVGGDPGRLPPVCGGPGSVPGAQRVVRQPRHHPPRPIGPGVAFDSENDTEVGARFVADQLAHGRDVETALKELCATFDGFYTLLVSNHDSFAVVRDAIACKPAVIAETDDWVAMGSEYRALAGLPGVEKAAIWEPEPEVVYAWTR